MHYSLEAVQGVWEGIYDASFSKALGDRAHMRRVFVRSDASEVSTHGSSESQKMKISQ